MNNAIITGTGKKGIDLYIKLKKLDKIIVSKKAEIIEVRLKDNQKIIPKLQFGNPIEDLSPLLPRRNFIKI